MSPRGSHGVDVGSRIPEKKMGSGQWISRTEGQYLPSFPGRGIVAYACSDKRKKLFTSMLEFTLEVWLEVKQGRRLLGLVGRSRVGPWATVLRILNNEKS